jgi:hypothetical protein
MVYSTSEITCLTPNCKYTLLFFHNATWLKYFTKALDSFTIITANHFVRSYLCEAIKWGYFPASNVLVLKTNNVFEMVVLNYSEYKFNVSLSNFRIELSVCSISFCSWRVFVTSLLYRNHASPCSFFYYYNEKVENNYCLYYTYNFSTVTINLCNLRPFPPRNSYCNEKVENNFCPYYTCNSSTVTINLFNFKPFPPRNSYRIVEKQITVILGYEHLFSLILNIHEQRLIPNLVFLTLMF